MNFIDIILIVIFSFSFFYGLKKGLIIELFTFLALFIGLYAGIHFSDALSEILKNRFNFTSDYLPEISFTIVFLIIGAMVYFGGKSIEKIISVVQLSLVNKLLGGIFTVLKMIFICGGIILLIESYDEKGDFLSNKIRRESLLYYPTKKVITICIPSFERSALFFKETLTNGGDNFSIQDFKSKKEK